MIAHYDEKIVQRLELKVIRYNAQATHTKYSDFLTRNCCRLVAVYIYIWYKLIIFYIITRTLVKQPIYQLESITKNKCVHIYLFYFALHF